MYFDRFWDFERSYEQEWILVMWKPVKGFEGLYLVSDIGEVYSLLTNKCLLPAKKRTGYLQVTLSKNTLLSYHLVHRIVAEAFIPNPDGKRQVNHIDGNKSNNSVSNLEWCTCRENIIHSIYELGNNKIPVNQFTKDGKFVKGWDSIIEASKGTGIKAQHIWRNAQKIRKSTGGFVFKYDEKRRFA